MRNIYLGYSSSNPHELPVPPIDHNLTLISNMIFVDGAVTSLISSEWLGTWSHCCLTKGYRKNKIIQRLLMPTVSSSRASAHCQNEPSGSSCSFGGPHPWDIFLRVIAETSKQAVWLTVSPSQDSKNYGEKYQQSARQLTGHPHPKSFSRKPWILLSSIIAILPPAQIYESAQSWARSVQTGN